MSKDKKETAVSRRNWKFWIGIILMLAAITMYVLSLDDSVIP